MATYRVLVVDDNPEVRRMVTASIKTLGPEIDVLDVPSAEEALFISGSLPLDLVVLDFRLPGMSGLEMVTRLQQRRPDIKIILVTGVEDEATRKQVAEAGVAAYFYKPIDIDSFLQSVKNSLWSGLEGQSSPISTQEPVSTLPTSGISPGGTAPTPEGKPSAAQKFRLSLDERLTALKQQMKAVSVLLVNETGQVMEVAGNPSLITTGSTMLSALVNAFKASQQVSQVVSREACVNMQYFAAHRYTLYVTPVGLNHALIALTAGFFEPDKLTSIDHYLQVAARDLQTILANKLAEEQAKLDEVSESLTELLKDIEVDRETLAGVEDMFSKASESDAKDTADGFWETLGTSDDTGEAHGTDLLSYDQARDLGLTPDDDQGS